MTSCKEIVKKDKSKFPLKVQVEIMIEDEELFEDSINDLEKCTKVAWIGELRKILENK